MQLIIATERFADIALRPIPGGFEAVLAGDALKRLVEASFGGASIELWDEKGPAQRLNVTDIRMAGRTTCVTLMSSGEYTLH
ncbi:hypothetical protein ERN12_01585 [Rhodobacteraceae bacterium]|nr:hypothetical protein ERN12_01585 [Paracoccaceae bacterium]